MKRTLTHLVPALLAVFCAVPALAAREFTPQSGLWMIPSENNGQPGRGFSLDVQGNTAFLQVFNYEKSGAATFHTAVGQLDAAASMTVPLLRFKGGRYLGGPARDAVEDGSVGKVTVTFTDGLNGTIQFPGESVQPISRFLVGDRLPYWWSMPTGNPEGTVNSGVSMQWTSVDRSGQPRLWNAWLSATESGQFQIRFNGGKWVSCALNSDNLVMECIDNDVYPATNPIGMLNVQRVHFRIIGTDVVGFMQENGDLNAQSVINGRVTGKGRVLTNDPEDCVITCPPAAVSVDMRSTWLLSNGAWIIDEENTGRAGRGVFIDQQDETLIVQTSDYLADGQPTFRMGTGRLPTVEPRKDAESLLPLARFAGGRNFGGSAQTGTQIALDGDAKLTFRRAQSGNAADYASGDITLPGESAQRMHRLELEPATLDMGNMLGEYLVRWRVDATQGSFQTQWMRLTRVQDGLAMNDDGTVQCYRNTSLSPYFMRCALLPSPNIHQNWIGSASITQSPFRWGAAEDSDAIARTRDRHGNWLGLGAVNLPGLAIPAD
ncbi:hypothetical protein [Diaphorobacter caeni]|uniref:hypothetical protein n=1 Tax=Diaphorobacter caeni TaxID=2784387 RepID=UPI0018904400|nr:hypothetical protein [Diaphorobacter caeni]MBF5005189.1 hypothetical protein [Diaphorobacter caeni]